jgi:hypothetical protein
MLLFPPTNLFPARSWIYISQKGGDTNKDARQQGPGHGLESALRYAMHIVTMQPRGYIVSVTPPRDWDVADAGHV